MTTLYDKTYINKENKYSKLFCKALYIGRHSISSLPSTLATTKDAFGGVKKTNHYAIQPGKMPKLEKHSKELVRQLTEDLDGYDSHVLFKKCEIWKPKGHSDIDYFNVVRFSVSINHETKACWISIVFTTDLVVEEDEEDIEPVLIPQPLKKEEEAFIPLRVRRPAAVAEEDLLDIDADEKPLDKYRHLITGGSSIDKLKVVFK